MKDFDWKALKKWHDTQDCNAHDEGLDCCVDRILERHPGYVAAEKAALAKRTAEARAAIRRALPPGEWFQWKDIERRTKLSWGPLREAFRVLEAEGAIEWRKRDDADHGNVFNREAWCDDEGNIHERWVVEEARLVGG